MPNKTLGTDKVLRPINWPLNGRLITRLDGSLLPDAHFQVLDNMRYHDGGIDGIGGMTKINASPFAYGKVQNGFHFKKTSPVTENHIFIQTSSGANSTIFKSDNSTSIPSQDTFSSFQVMDSNNTVYFSEAPDQSMVFCDGYKNYIYSGDEYRVAKVVNFDPSGTFFKDQTIIASNNLTDTNNVFVLSGVSAGSDTSAKALYHFDNDATDATSNVHNLTATSMTYSALDYVFATHSAVFNGSSGYFSIADHADYNFSGGIFTIDARIKVDSLAAANPIYYQNTSADADSFNFHVNTDGSLHILITESSTPVVDVSTPAGVIVAGTWYHVALVENGDSWYIFVNGVLQVLGTDTSRAANYTGSVQIGKDDSIFFAGKMDEFRVSSSARWTSSFTIPVGEYGISTNTVHMYIGSTRPLSGVKFYTNTANTTAAVCTAFYWNGSTWTTAGTITDGTATVGGTKTLGTTGTIEFASTVSTAKVKIINENLAYYYYFIFTGIDAATSLSQVTVKVPVQELVDIWDGMPRQIYSYLVYTTAYADYTTNVYQLDYDSSDTTTYVNIGALTSSQYTYCGFNERLIGVKVFLGGTSVNTTVCVAYVDYWNGTTWTNVGTIDDGTSVGGVSFARTGTITWNDPGQTNEFPNSVGNSSQWYYYRIRFSATLSATVRVDTITGIPVQVSLRPYRYPVLWQNRLWLLNDQSNYRNSALGSSYGTNCVFNGDDSGMLTFGGMKDLECGASLFTRYGSNIYENLIVCKKNETFLVDGTSFTGDSSGSGAYVVYKISSTRGCIAPLTMRMCDTGYEVAPGLTKHTLMWLSNSGMLMFDSNSMIEVSNDIGDRFDPKSSTYMNPSISEKAASFYDSSRGEYHLLLPTGVSTYPNEEWVYDVVRKKWYQTKRSTKYLWSGWEVEDSSGNKYCYGGTGDGYIERLEYGNTIDGLSILYKFRLPDSLLNASWDTRKEIRQIRLVGICKTATTAQINVTHYADGCSTASTPAVVDIDPNKSGYRFFKSARSVSFRGTTHSLEFDITTSNETIGFSPLYVGGQYRLVDYDLEEA
jgi:hypothetical protein